MKDTFAEIADILEKEQILYNDLLSISRKKTEILANEEVAGLESITSVEQSIIVRIGELEKERNKFIDQLAQENNMDAADITISSIIDMAKGNARVRLENVSRDLIKTVEEQKSLNDRNSMLIKSKLDFIDFSLNIITGQNNSGSTYSKGGQVESGDQKRNLFDQKV